MDVADAGQSGPSILVTGATSQIGEFLLPRLAEAGHKVCALSRDVAKSGASGVQWITGDLSAAGWSLPAGINPGVVIHLAPLPLLPSVLPSLAIEGVDRLIAFGTTSRFTKARSSDIEERKLAMLFEQAESGIISICQTCGIDWTLLRPTLIYGRGTDGTVGFIARMIRRWGWFPVAGRAVGLRQPVHAEDLAIACLRVMVSGASRNRGYNLGGAEALSYDEMVKRVFRAMGRKPRLIRLPAMFYRAMVGALARVPGLSGMSPAMVERMNQDLTFDNTPATADFGWDPRAFRPDARATGALR